MLDLRTKLDFLDKPRLECGNLVMTPESAAAFWKGAAVKLPPLEFVVTYVLAEHPNRIFTKEHLAENYYDERSLTNWDSVASTIRRLRASFRKVDPTFNRPATLYGYGGWRWNRETNITEP